MSINAKLTKPGNQTIERITIICLNRQGGMVHYHSQLVNALSQNLKVQALTANTVSSDSYLPSVKLQKYKLGKTIIGTLLFVINPATYWKLFNQIRAFKPQVVHVTSTYVAHVVPIIFIRILLRKKIVFTIHDPTLHEGDSFLNFLTLRLLKTFSHAYVVHARIHKEVLKTDKPIAVMPIGIFDFPLKASTAGSMDQIGEANEILFFGRIEKYKGLDILLQSTPAIFTALPDWKIVIAGKGSLQSYQHLMADRRIECINRYIQDEEISSLMRKAKIVVLPYRSATQSAVIPLAYAFSKAIVSTAVGAIPDILIDGETGILVEPNNPELLARAIIRLAKDAPLRERLGKAGFQFANKELNWSSIGMKHVEFYQRHFG